MNVLNTWLDMPVVERLGTTLLHFVWQATAVALVAGVVLRLMRGRSANARYVVACGAMLVMVVAPVVTFGWFTSAEALPEAWPVNAVPVGDANEAEAVSLAVETAVVDALPAETSRLPESAELPVSTMSWPERVSGWCRPYLSWIVLGWGLGVLALSCRLVLGWTAMQRLRVFGIQPVPEGLRRQFEALCETLRIRVRVRLLDSALAKSPMAMGWLRPVILVPTQALTGLTPDQLRAVIAHELAHIRRYDYLVNLVQAVMETVLFYHPAVWWISHRIRVEREHCCDDVAVAAGGDAVGYARALADLAAMRLGPERLAVAVGGGSLMARVRRLVGVPVRPTQRSQYAAGALVLLCAVAFVLIGPFDGVNAEPAPEGTAVTTSQPAGETVEEDSPPETVERWRHFVALVIGEKEITFEGHPTTWEQLPELLERVPNRPETVLCLAVTGNDLPRSLVDMAHGRAGRLSREFGFEYLSYVGVHPLGSKGDRSQLIEKKNADASSDSPAVESTSDDSASDSRVYLVQATLVQGDPDGSPDSGNVKVVASPVIVTKEGSPFAIFQGAEVPYVDGEKRVHYFDFGWKLEGVVKPLSDGRVQLDLTLSDTKVAARSEEQLRLGTRSTRTLASLKLDESVKLPLDELPNGEQVWAHLKVHEQDLNPEDVVPVAKEQPSTRPAGSGSSENTRPDNIRRRPLPGGEARTPVAVPSPPNTSHMEDPEPIDETLPAIERYNALSEALARLVVERIRLQIEMENLPSTASELLEKYPKYRDMLDQESEVTKAREKIRLLQADLDRLKNTRNENHPEVKRAAEGLDEAYAEYNAITNKRKAEILEYATTSAKTVYENALSAETLLRKMLDELEQQMTRSVRNLGEGLEGGRGDRSSAGAGVVYVLGNVKRPGAYAHEGTLTLLQLLAASSGITPEKTGWVRVRRQLGDGRESITLVDVKRILDGEEPDFMLNAGDVLQFVGGTVSQEEASKRGWIVCGQIPDPGTEPDHSERRRTRVEKRHADDAGTETGKGFVYISGEVARPGTYLLSEDGTLTLLKLLSSAGGLSSDQAKQVILRRRHDDGRQDLSIHSIDKIMSGEKADFVLQPNDEITVSKR